MAIANATGSAMLASSKPARNVAKPSGKLWKASAAGEHAGLHEPGAAGIVKHGARLVRIDLFRHKAVDDRNDGNAQEERTHAQPRASALRVESRNELVHALRQNLHKGDVEHDAGGQAKGPRHELRPRVAVAHGDGGADRRG